MAVKAVFKETYVQDPAATCCSDSQGLALPATQKNLLKRSSSCMGDESMQWNDVNWQDKKPHKDVLAIANGVCRMYAVLIRC